MSLVDQVKATLKSKQGKVIAIGAAGGLAYLYWSRGRTAGAPDTGDQTTTNRVPGAAGAGGTTVTDTGRPTTNQAWLERAVSALSNPPYNKDALAVYNALRRALDGLQVSSAQQAYVSLAIQILGSPPEGMPPLNATPPAGGTGDGGTAPLPPGSALLDHSAVRYVPGAPSGPAAAPRRRVPYIVREDSS